MLNLIRNEWMKLWSKKGTWVMLILLATIIFGFTGLAKLTESLFDDPEWNETLEEQIEVIDKTLETADLDEHERIELEIEKADLQGMHVISIEKNEPQTREQVIGNSFGMMQIVTLLTIIVASGIVSAEFSEGTIKMLLSRPVSRWKVLTSKYVTVLLFALLATAITYVVTVVGAFVFFPGETASTLSFNGKEMTVLTLWEKSLYLMFLSLINVLIIATLAFMLGVVFRSTSMAIGISMFLYFTGGLIVTFLADYSFAKYILFAHTNLTSYEFGYGILSGITMPFSVMIIIIYGILFLALSFLSFIKRDVTA